MSFGTSVNSILHSHLLTAQSMLEIFMSSVTQWPCVTWHYVSLYTLVYYHCFLSFSSVFSESGLSLIIMLLIHIPYKYFLIDLSTWRAVVYDVSKAIRQWYTWRCYTHCRESGSIRDLWNTKDFVAMLLTQIVLRDHYLSFWCCSEEKKKICVVCNSVGQFDSHADSRFVCDM
jgi:hypothetical protein